MQDDDLKLHEVTFNPFENKAQIVHFSPIVLEAK
jgi:hypothetical protein